ncbi:MAG: hypothetical protein ACR2KG_06120 [Nocardioidaceae bacterium]
MSKKVTMTTRIDLPHRRKQMNLIHEDLARAHIEARLEQARELRRSHQMSRIQRLARRAERASKQAGLLLARSL